MFRTRKGKAKASPLIVRAVSTTTDMHAAQAHPTLTWRRPPWLAAAGIQDWMSAVLPNATWVHRRLWNSSNMRALLFHALLNPADGFVAPFHASAEHADPVANGK